MYDCIIVPIALLVSQFSIYNIFFLHKGQVGISLNTHWYQANDPSNPKDMESAERGMAMEFGWFAQPVFGEFLVSFW